MKMTGGAWVRDSRPGPPDSSRIVAVRAVRVRCGSARCPGTVHAALRVAGRPSRLVAVRAVRVQWAARDSQGCVNSPCREFPPCRLRELPLNSPCREFTQGCSRGGDSPRGRRRAVRVRRSQRRICCMASTTSSARRRTRASARRGLTRTVGGPRRAHLGYAHTAAPARERSGGFPCGYL